MLSRLKLWVSLCVLREFFVFSVVNFNHKGHGGCTEDTTLRAVLRTARIVLNQDFHKIFKIDKMFSNPAHPVNLTKILVQDNPIGVP